MRARPWPTSWRSSLSLRVNPHPGLTCAEAQELLDNTRSGRDVALGLSTNADELEQLVAQLRELARDAGRGSYPITVLPTDIDALGRAADLLAAARTVGLQLTGLEPVLLPDTLGAVIAEADVYPLDNGPGE